MTLSELVRDYRLTHGLSQRQFAAACGLSNGYISMVENNENPKTGLPVEPSLKALKKIAGGMGISVHDLFSKIDDLPVSLLSDSPADLVDQVLQDKDLMQLINQYLQLDDNDKYAVRLMVDSMSQKK